MDYALTAPLKKPLHEFLSRTLVSKGWRRLEFADRLEVAPSYLSQIENGHANFPEKLRDRVSELLNLSADKRQEFEDLVHRSNLARKYVSGEDTTKSLTALIEAHGDALSEEHKRELFFHALRLLEADGASLPGGVVQARRKTGDDDGSPLSPEDFMEAALSGARFNTRYGKRGVVDITQALELHCSCKSDLQTVFVERMPPQYGNFYACIEQRAVGDSIIVEEGRYRSAENGNWDTRFDLAHELGHHHLHRVDDPETVVVRSLASTKDRFGNMVILEDGKMEQQANTFAIAALVPLRELVGGMSDLEIAKRFKAPVKELGQFRRYARTPILSAWFAHIVEEK